MVFFDWDSAELPADARQTVQFVSTNAARCNWRNITVTGHADKSGGNDYNMALSLRRAGSVKDGLVREGVAATSIALYGKGEEQPLVNTADGVREPQNRRVEIAMGAGPSTAAFFTGSDLEYCQHLSRLYRRNVAQSNADSVAGTALAQCEAGDFARGIPTLVRLLNDARFDFPRHRNWNA